MQFRDEEKAAIEAAYLDGDTDEMIAEKLNAMPINKDAGIVRTDRSVYRIRHKMRLLRQVQQPVFDQSPENDRRADAMFQMMLKRAINQGRESARIGIVRDDSPFVGKVIRPEPVYSGCGSAASLCADIAPEESTTGELNYA